MSETTTTESLASQQLITWTGEWLHNRLEATLSGSAELTGSPNQAGALLKISETYTLGVTDQEPDHYGKQATFANNDSSSSVTDLVRVLTRWKEAGLFDGKAQEYPNFLNTLYPKNRAPEVIPVSRIESFLSANKRGGTGEAVYVNRLGGLVINASFHRHPRKMPILADKLTSKKIVIPPSATYQLVRKLVELS